LDEDSSIGPCHPIGPSAQCPVQLQVGQNPFIVTIQVFGGFVFSATYGYDYDPMSQDNIRIVLGNGGLEISHKS
jgi:hypothetical protein